MFLAYAVCSTVCRVGQLDELLLFVIFVCQESKFCFVEFLCHGRCAEFTV